MAINPAMKTTVCSTLAVMLLTGMAICNDNKPLSWVCSVSSAEGKPVAGAEVYVCCPPNRELILEQPIIAHGRTDESGMLKLSLSVPRTSWGLRAEVLAVSETAGVGVGSIFQSEQQDKTAPHQTAITLLPAAAFKVRILKPAGSPAAGLEVWVGSYVLHQSETSPSPVFGDMTRLPGKRWQATTDSEGRCQIPNLPRNAGIYLVHGDRRYAQLPGKFHISLPPAPTADGTEYTLPLTQPASICGRVVLPDGRAAPGTIVSIFEPTAFATAYGTEVHAGTDGRFVIEGIPASQYNLHYEIQEPLFDEWIGSNRDSLRVEAGKALDLGDLRATRVAIVTAEVVNAETGAEVEEPLQFRLEPGHHDLNYRTRRYPPAEYHPPERGDEVSVNVKEGEHKTIQFKLKPVKVEDLVTGVLLAPDGKPAAKCLVALATREWSADLPPPAVTGPDGAFKIAPPVKAEELSVVAWDADKAMSNPQPVKRGEQAMVKLLNKGFATVTGRVCDDAGLPVKNASVQCNIAGLRFGFHSGPVPLSSTTDGDGRFSFPRLWTTLEDVSFYCEATGYGSSSNRDVKLTSDKAVDLDFVLTKPQAGIGIAGIVVDSKGRPVPGAQLFCQGDNQPRPHGQLTTDLQGRFEISPLIAGQVYVRAKQKTETFSRETHEWVNVPNTHVRLVLPDADGSLTGTVLDSEGQPVADALVRSFERDRDAHTDAQGRFALMGMVKGWSGVEFSYHKPDSEEIKHEERLKTGMKDARIEMPAHTKQRPALPAAPRDLTGKAAAPIEIATWINTAPLAAKAGGKVRILDFWGIQCAPCIAGLPKVRDFWNKHRNDNLEIIALTTYPAAEVQEFLARHPDYTQPFAIETEGSTSHADYDVRGVPLYVVIDTGGHIVSTGHDWDEASATALKLLAVP